MGRVQSQASSWLMQGSLSLGSAPTQTSLAVRGDLTPKVDFMEIEFSKTTDYSDNILNVAVQKVQAQVPGALVRITHTKRKDGVTTPPGTATEGVDSSSRRNIYLLVDLVTRKVTVYVDGAPVFADMAIEESPLLLPHLARAYFRAWDASCLTYYPTDGEIDNFEADVY